MASNDQVVTLTIDTSVFQKGLDDAIKQLNDFSAKVKAAGDSVNTATANMKKSVDPLKTAFGELGTTIAAIGIVSFVESVVEGGAAISRLAESTNMSTQGVLEMSRAMATVGKDTDKLTTAMGFLEKSAENANNGNLKLRADFAALGMSMEDLHKLSPEEVFAKVVKGLAGMEDPALRARVAYDLLSRQMKGVDFKALNDQMEKNKGTMADAAEGADAAQKAFAAWNVFIGDVKNQMLTLLAPILKLVTYITNLADEFGLAKIAGDALIGVFLGITGLAMWKVFAQIASAVAGLALSMGALLIEFAPIIAGFVAVAAAAATAYAVYQKITGQVDTVTDGYKKLGTEIGETVSAGWDKLTKLVNGNTDAINKNKDASKVGMVQGPTLDPNAGAIQALRNQYEMMKLTNDEAKKKLELEIKLVGSSESRKAAELANFENERKHLMETQKLDGEIAKLRAEERNKEGENHGKEIAVLNQMKTLENQRYNSFKEQNSELIRAKEIEKERLNYLELYNKVQDDIKELDRQTTQSTMTDNQKKIAEIQKWADAQTAAYAKIRQAELGSGADVSQDKMYQDRIKAIQEFTQQEQAATQKSIDASRSWSNEWQKSINQYVEDAHNGATEAKKLFDDATKGMEDVIVNFAKTGKLSFDQLLTQIAEDILRSQVKQLFANLFSTNGLTSGGGGSSSLFAGVGKLLGFAEGGTIPTNGPVLVGEKGPELLSGAGGMTVTPNSEINNASTTHVTYNINAVDSRSFQQMIAQDPSFIYAVTVRGQNMIPGGGR